VDNEAYVLPVSTVPMFCHSFLHENSIGAAFCCLVDSLWQVHNTSNRTYGNAMIHRDNYHVSALSIHYSLKSNIFSNF